MLAKLRFKTIMERGDLANRLICAAKTTINPAPASKVQNVMVATIRNSGSPIVVMSMSPGKTKGKRIIM